MSGRAPVPYLSRYSRFAPITVSNTTLYGSFASQYGGTNSEDIAAIYVGTTGSVTIVGTDNVSVTLQNCPQGTVLPVSPLKVTAGSNLIALFW